MGEREAALAPEPFDAGDFADAGGAGTMVSVTMFVLGLAALFIGISWYVTDLQGGGVSSAATGVDPERGEAIFWGEGTCHTCHSIGERGNMKRCPNLGDSKHGPPIGERAALRALERAEQTGTPYTPTDYLIECLASPSAYLVEGFPDKLMPLVYTGQVDLDPEEVMSVIAYLQSVGGDVDLEAIQQSMSRHGRPILEKASAEASGATARKIDFPYPEWEVLEPEQFTDYTAAADAVARAAFRLDQFDEEQTEIYDEIVEEWLEEGRDIFDAAKCWQCHHIAGEDFGEIDPGTVGPDLTSIGAIQPAEYIMESILTPDAMIVPPLEDHMAEGRSKMPGFADRLNVHDLLRLVEYLQRQTGDTREGSAGE